MANNTWESLRKRDADVLASFERIAQALSPSIARLDIRIAEGHNPTISIALTEARSNNHVAALCQLNGSIATWLNLNMDPRGSITVQRPKDRATDHITMHFQDQLPIEQLLPLLDIAVSEFPHLTRADSIERILGPDIAKFYNARDIALVRLEGVTQKLIEDTDTYRRQLDERADAKESLRQTELAERSEALDLAAVEREQALERRQQELDDYKKSLDDRQSKHARRQLRQDLQQELRERSNKFSLTEGTTKKRRAVHALFLSLLGVALAYLAAALWQTLNQDFSIATAIRLAVGLAGVATVFLLYIRWTDQWFREHAQEEFRLKRMGLDIDRASWVVETALEWQHENQQPIPAHLLEQLSRDLFAYKDRATPVRHPVEELGAAVLAGASSLKVQLPGVGEAMLNRRGVRQVSEVMEKSS